MMVCLVAFLFAMSAGRKVSLFASHYRHHPHAVLVPAMRDDVHGRAARLQGRDKELVMGDALCDWIGWKRPR
jgi:hypothetical protein